MVCAPVELWKSLVAKTLADTVITVEIIVAHLWW